MWNDLQILAVFPLQATADMQAHAVRKSHNPLFPN
jgi:hypothetical protein